MVRVGNPVQVQPSRRRVSAQSFGGFLPTAIPGLRAWYDASRIPGLADGAAVATWSDLSGNGHHLTQGTGALQPTWEANELNGLPVVRFVDGKFLANMTFPDFPDAATVFVVGKTTAGSTAFFEIGSGTINTGMLFFFTGTPDVNFRVMGPSTTVTAAQALNENHIWTSHYDGSNARLYKDGALIGGPSAVGGLTNTLDRFHVGITGDATTFPLVGDIAEIRVYNSGLTAASHNPNGVDLASKWGLTWTVV